MPTRTFDDVVQRLATNVPGCPFPVIEKYVRDAAIEVCEKALVWRDIQSDITLVDGTYEYAYTPPVDTEVHAIIHAAINEVKMTALTMEQLYQIYPDWPNTDAEHRSMPRYIVHMDPDTFAVALVPDGAVTYDVSMMVALKPLRTAAGMEQAVLDDIENVVMEGALEYLYRLPEKSWTDKKLAEFHGARFRSRIVERRARANLGAGRASMTVKMRPMA